jgi:colanic acid biosynthesis glycosyl transferase WcaI
MHLTLLTQYYLPEIGAPQRRLSHLAEGLVKQGHRVTVLTAMPNYPTGKIYPGYGGLVRTEEINGVRIVRTWIYPTQSAGFVCRLSNYFSFVFSSLMLGGWYLEPCDYLITESPPLFLGITGFLLSRWKHARWIFNVSDLWPESAVRLGMLNNKMALRLSEWLEAFCYHHAWLITGQSQSIIENIRQRFPDVQTYHFSNGVDTLTFRPENASPPARAALHQNAQCVALYAGLHGLAQGLDQVIQAAQLVQADSHLGIVLLGDGPTKAELVQEANARALTNVTFLDPVPPNAMPGWIAAADIALVTLKTYIPGAVPSKLYEAMAAGVPVILVAEGEPAEIVRTHNAGIVIAPGDIAGLANTLKTLASDPALRRMLGANGRCAAEQFYDRNVIVQCFGEFLKNDLTKHAKDAEKKI